MTRTPHPAEVRNRLGAINQMLKTTARLPEAVANLRRAISEHDGMGTGGDGIGRSSGITSPVEGAAMASAGLWRDLDDVARNLDQLAYTVSRLNMIIERHATVDAGDKPLCQVGAYNEPWSVSEGACWEIAEHYPSGQPRPEYLCAKHRTKMRRAQRDDPAQGSPLAS